MKIIITAGGTEEKIDQVRRITNTSSGATGFSLAQDLQLLGHTVFYIRAKRAPTFAKAFQEIVFESSEDLEKSIQHVLDNANIDIVIQCAAVSDFVVDKIILNGEIFEPESIRKIDSRDSVELVLKSRAKIIHKIKTLSPRSAPIVIGFKLTNTLDLQERTDHILKLSQHPEVDYVVHNDLSEITDTTHPTRIYFQDQVLLEGHTKKDLAHNIQTILQQLELVRSSEENYDTLS